jgi:hypothetical protein
LPAADWRSSERYEALSELSSADLAWEFLRRNPRYQDDFARWSRGDTADAARWEHWGLTFPADPTLSARDQAIFWRPDAYPRTVVLTAAPPTARQSIPFEPQSWRGELVEREGDDGVHALLQTPRLQHRLWMPRPLADGEPVACVVPLGDDAACGTAAAVQFWRHLKGERAAPTREPGTKLRRAHLSLLALDGRRAGDSYRALAERLYGAGRIAGESWRTSSLRDATIRLVRTGTALASGDYRRLLRQKSEE